MFRSIGRTILNLPIHVIVLLASLPVFIYVDAWHVVQNPFFVDATHVTLVALAALCLVALFADGSSPKGTRRRAAFFVTLALAAIFLLVLLATDLIEPASPQTVVGSDNYPNGIRAEWSFPDVQSGTDTAAFVVNVILALVACATLVLSICGPACAALFGVGRALPESWGAFRRNYWRIGFGGIISVVFMLPTIALFMPLMTYWEAVGFVDDPHNAELQAKFQVAWDICNRIGPRSIAQSGAAAAFLLCTYLWAGGRLIANMLAKQTASRMR